MVNTVLTSDDLTVLGGPAKVEVSVDFGPKGERGSNIYAGLGQPNDSDTDLGFTPQVFDMYINILTSDSEYMFLYQYQNVAGVRTWVNLMRLIPNMYSLNNVGTFVSGERQINIPVILIVPLSNVSNLSSANFNIQHSIVNNSNPVSSTLSVAELETFNEELTLPLTIKAVEFDGEGWIDLEGQKTVHLFITVV
jgi:hypothetical protein